MPTMEEVYGALENVRAPLQTGEYDLHRLLIDALDGAGIAWRHEAKLGPRCRIDLMCGGIGIEIKRGKPEHGRLLQQLTRYAACEEVSGLIVACERNVTLPPRLCGKPVKTLCLNRLWGIAL